MADSPPQRVIAYVDGFNFYFGIKAAKLRHFLWLNPHALANAIKLPQQVVVKTKYFTARVSGGKPHHAPDVARSRSGSRKRQTTYLDALGTIPDLEIFEGHYNEEKVKCFECGNTWLDAEEKMTDVNIATEMLVDAFASRFDTAFVVSGDTDLVPPIKAIRRHFPHKRVIAVFPPERVTELLKKETNGYFSISRGHLKRSQLPEVVVGPTGYELRRPPEWTKS